MKILITCLHHPTCTGRWLYRAYTRLGYDVRHIGAYPNAAAAEGPHAWQPMGMWNCNWQDWKPDIVIYADTVYNEWRHDVYSAVPHVNVTTCNNVCNMSSLEHDHYFVAHKDSTVWPVQGDNMTWMPCGYDVELHVPSRVPWKDRLWDVALLGASSAKRAEYLEALKAAGLSVYADKGIFWQDYVDTYHEARISLCVNDQKSPMMRYFESAAMECLIISDYCRDIVDLGGDDCIVTVQSPADAVFYARHYLARPQLALEKIGLAGAWVMDHNWDERAMQIVRWLEGERITA